MSAKSCHARNFHTAYTTADNRDFLRLGSRNDFVFLGLHGVRIECATSHTCGVGQILIVCNAVVVRHIEATVVAADTRQYVAFAILHKFCDPFGVGKELTSNAHTVDFAFCDCLCRGFRRHTSCANDRNIDNLLDFFAIFKVAVLRHIYRRMRPVPCVVRSVVRVEHVVACVLEHFRRDFALLHIASHFHVVFSRKCALTEAFCLGHDGISQRNRIIFTANFLDFLDDFDGETISVFD